MKKLAATLVALLACLPACPSPSTSASDASAADLPRRDSGPRDDGPGLDSSGDVSQTDGSRTEAGLADALPADAATGVAERFYFARDKVATLALVDRPGAYDYSPTALAIGGSWKVWYCGGGANIGLPGDNIFHFSVGSNGTPTAPISVLPPALDDDANDGLHACAPSVIKHASAALHGGADYYLLYYECARRYYPLPSECGGTTGISCSSFFSMFTETCLAFSTDGVTWKKYNANLWTQSQTFGDLSTNPTPVRAADPQLLKACKYQYDTALKRHRAAQSCRSLGLYGVGHPSAVVVNSRIWLFYYDSKGAWKDRGVFVAKSSDGIHFDPPQKTNLTNPIEVAYYPGVVNGAQGLFIGTMKVWGRHSLAWSRDGRTWKWIGSPADDAFTMFGARDDLCSLPGQHAFVTDSAGALSSLLGLQLITGQGHLGPSDNVQPGQACYDVAEDGAFGGGRGATWGLYAYSGAIRLLDRVNVRSQSNASLFFFANGHRQSYASWTAFLGCNGFDSSAYDIVPDVQMARFVQLYPLTGPRTCP